MHSPTYDAAPNPYEAWSETPGGWDGYTDELGDEQPTITSRPGPLWPVVVHYLFLAALVAGLLAVVAR